MLPSSKPSPLPATEAPKERKTSQNLQRIRNGLARKREELIDAIAAGPLGQGRNRGEILASEIIPTLECCQFLEKEAAKLLRARKIPARKRPLWLAGTKLTIHREPFGRVLIIGPANYPFFLPISHALHALAAGNTVLIKPAPGCEQVAVLFAEIVGHPDTVRVTSSDLSEVAACLEKGIDLLVFTGGTTAGLAVSGLASRYGVPVISELSGCDACFVFEKEKLELAARSLVFGLRFNASATCIAPRRVFVEHALEEELLNRMKEALTGLQIPLADKTRDALLKFLQRAEGAGADLVSGSIREDAQCAPYLLRLPKEGLSVWQEDLFAPLVTVTSCADVSEALRLDGECPYALGATIFGSSRETRRLSEGVNAGTILLNDMIAPTADPWLPFGARGRSGSGVTRGAEGLLAMTRPKAIVERRGGSQMYYQPTGRQEHGLLDELVEIFHTQATPRWSRLGLLLRKALEISRSH